VIAKCEFTYSQLVASLSSACPDTQACTLGSMNRPRPRSMSITARALSNASPARPSTIPRTSRYSQ
jgi:hypothetical protein